MYKAYFVVALLYALWYTSLMEKIPPSHETLHQLYVVENLTAEEIALKTGYSRSRIFVFLDRYGIDRNKRQVILPPLEHPSVPERPISLPLQKSKRGHPLKIPDADWLRTRYWDDNQNVTDIGKELGVNPNSVTKALIRYGIPIKPRHLCYRDKQKTYSNFRHGLRYRIMERDSFTCRMCSTTENLEVHHIIPQRLGGRNILDNGITLCVSCHTSIGFCEINWIGKLLELRGSHSTG